MGLQKTSRTSIVDRTSRINPPARQERDAAIDASVGMAVVVVDTLGCLRPAFRTADDELDAVDSHKVLGGDRRDLTTTGDAGPLPSFRTGDGGLGIGGDSLHPAAPIVSRQKQKTNPRNLVTSLPS